MLAMLVLPELHGFVEHGLVIWFVFIRISHLKPVKPVLGGSNLRLVEINQHFRVVNRND